MDEAQRQVLAMVRDGAITADEANRLLTAMGAPGVPETPAGDETQAPADPFEPAETSAPGERAALDDEPEPSRQVLAMVRDGAITAGEADRLLGVMDDEPLAADDSDAPTDEAPSVSGEEVIAPPDLDRFRHLWQVPFAIALAALVVSALCMSVTYNTFWFICGWSVFMLAALATGIAFWSRTATWLHVRVRERDGHRFAISLPVPLRLIGWAVPLARHFVRDEEAALHLDTAAAFAAAIDDELREPGAEPLVVDVNDEGDQVQVYIG